MTGQYRIFGSELSPYSVKVRSYFRYKQIAHEWIVRNAESADEYQKYARIPIIPLVVTPDEKSLQDSTPIIEEMERRFPQPSILPEDTVSQFIATLLEEFGDERAVGIHRAYPAALRRRPGRTPFPALDRRQQRRRNGGSERIFC